jgi:hypothetical protein
MGVVQINSPFKFLDSYDRDDKNIFFGREQETAELYDRVFETNLVVLYGASGTGKSSLINCGLSNEFEPSDWLPIFIRRRDSIMDSWRSELQKIAIKKMPEDTSIIDLLRSVYLDYFKPVYLVFDQFEELFILGTKEEQKEFFDELDNLLKAGLQCKVIISMREEYIAHLSEYEYVLPNLFDNRLRVEKMNSRNLKEVIIHTAEAFDIEIENEEEVAGAIIEKLRDKNHQVDLATLQVYLDRLYRLDAERRGDENRPIRFDKALVESTGDLENVMARFLDEQLGVIEQELIAKNNITEKGIPLHILFALVTDNGTKQAVELDDIKKQLKRAKNIDANIIDYCIERFKDMRILRELSE